MVANAWGASFSTNTVWFASEKDMKVFQSFDHLRQVSLIIENSGKVLILQKANTNAN